MSLVVWAVDAFSTHFRMEMECLLTKYRTVRKCSPGTNTIIKHCIINKMVYQKARLPKLYGAALLHYQEAVWKLMKVLKFDHAKKKKGIELQTMKWYVTLCVSRRRELIIVSGSISFAIMYILKFKKSDSILVKCKIRD